MVTPGYEGGIGGKFRRRQLRRAAATPYDRPPAAARGLRPRAPEPEGNGWLAKLVDPASRFIASSASRLFSSMFRKRLTAPPAAEAPGENSQSVQVTEAGSDELSAELQENKADSENNATNNSDSNIILEFEQLLKQKTFTRAQFEHLTEILRSRTLELDVSKPVVNNDKVDEENVSLPEKELESSRSHEDLTSPQDILAIPDDRAASPVELAKAYMGSRVSTVSASALSWRSHLFHDHKKLPSNSTLTTKPFDLKGTRSVRFSGPAEIPDSGYLTPRSHGRSAIYRMSRSPYFKGEGSSKDVYVGSLILRTPGSTRQSGGREALKRSCSVLDSDFGSFGPTRRIRQKSTVMSPSKFMHSVLPGNLHASPSTPFKKDVQDDSSLIQKPLWLDEQEENGDNEVSNNAVTPVLPQSKEMEKRILQQLDKLVPSPKEKSSKLKANLLDESPANVMQSFSGQALRNRKEDIYSKYKMDQSKNLYSVRDSPMSDIRNSLSHKQERTGENGPSTSTSGVKLMSDANNMQDIVISATAAMRGKVAADVMILGPIAVSPCRKPAFQMSAPKDTLEVNNTYTLTDTTGPLKDKDEVKMSTGRPSILRMEGPPLTTSTSISSSSDFSKASDMKLSIDSNADNSKGFTFPFASVTSSSQPTPTPMPNPLADKSVMQKGQMVVPLFSFGSKDANRVEFSSTITMSSFSETSDLGNVISNATTTATLKGSNADKHEGQMSVGDVDSTDKSASNGPIVFSFGGSGNENLSNGSPNSSSASSAAPVMTCAGSTASMILSTAIPVSASSSITSVSSEAPIFSTDPSFQFGSTPSMASPTSTSQSLSKSTATPVSASSSSTSVSSEAPISSTVPSFQFGSTPSMASPTSTSRPLSKSTITDLEEKSGKASPFSMNSANPGTTTIFKFGGSSSAPMAVSLFSRAESDSILAASTVSSIGSSSIAPAASTLFSSGDCSQSVLAPESAFSCASNSIFKFGSTLYNDSSSSAMDNSTKASVSVTGFIGTESTQVESGTSHFSESSASQFGSLYSSPTLGMNAFASSSLGSSQFGAATGGANPFSSSSTSSFLVAAGSSGLSATSSCAPAATSIIFGSTFQPSTSSAFGTLVSSSSSPSTGLAFGVSASGSSPLVFGLLSAPVSSINPSDATTLSSSSGQPVFASLNTAIGFSSATPGNDQMNVEDSLADDTNQTAVNLVPHFGQPGTSSSMPVFGAPVVQPAVPTIFQFGSHQNPTFAQNLPFQAPGNPEFPQGGSFSLGSGGGDKSGRKFVKVRRDKLRKK